MLKAVEHNQKLQKNGICGRGFTDKERQKIRLAALLHDIGHFPLSHAMEQPIRRALFEKDDPSEPKGKGRRNWLLGPLDETSQAQVDEQFSHESFGQTLLQKRRDLKDALGKFNENGEIGWIFTGDYVSDEKKELLNSYSQFITGTLDADRMDFLLRDAKSSGFAFGNIDLDYLLENLCVDKHNRLYVDYKGVNALEHYITARYFSYNVTYHKTVMGFELLAKHAYYQMLKSKSISVPGSEIDLLELAKNDNNFAEFTDEYFWKHLRSWRTTHSNKWVRDSLLLRRPLSLLDEERRVVEILEHDSPDQFERLKENNQFADRGSFGNVLDRFGLDRKCLAVLTTNQKFEKYAASVRRGESPKKEWQLCRVMIDDKVRPLVDIPSIIKKLAYFKVEIRRLYYLQDPTKPRIDRRQIRKALRGAL